VTVARRLIAAILAVVATVLVCWRVLAPAEVLAPVTGVIPVASVHTPGVTGKTAGAPLIVADRIRVFAAKRQIRADAPVDETTSFTPKWSYRRWPQQLSGVVAIGPTVVSRWSDGKLVAIDGLTGKIVWQAAGPPAGSYQGGRDGASTVWAPPGLLTAGTRVLVAGGGQVVAFDASGAQLWSAPACADGFTTTGGQYVCPTGAYDVATGHVVAGWPTGMTTPLGCATARSECEGAPGWLTTTAAPRRMPAQDTSVAAGVPLRVAGPSVAATSWSWTDPAGGVVQVLGGAAGKIYLLTGARRLVIVDAATGAVRGSFKLAVGGEGVDWSPGLWQVTGSYVAVERIDDPNPDSVDHYFTFETAIIAAT
jgi:outer membrane protein assembly factor BamB